MPRKKSAPATGSDSVDKGSGALSATDPGTNPSADSGIKAADQKKAAPRRRTPARSAQAPSLAATAASETAPYQESPAPRSGNGVTDGKNIPQTEGPRMKSQKTSRVASAGQAAEPYDLGEDMLQQSKSEMDHSWLEKRAWEIWMSEGCPDGRALDHWLQAERERH